MRHTIAASIIVFMAMVGVAHADADDIKWIAQCLKDNQDAKVECFRCSKILLLHEQQDEQRRNQIHYRVGKDARRGKKGMRQGSRLEIIVSLR